MSKFEPRLYACISFDECQDLVEKLGAELAEALKLCDQYQVEVKDWTKLAEEAPAQLAIATEALEEISEFEDRPERLAANALAKIRDGKLLPDTQQLSASLEKRGDLWIRVDKSGGCGPATRFEVEMWALIHPEKGNAP